MSPWLLVALVPVALLALAVLVVAFEGSALDILGGKWWEVILQMLALGAFVAFALGLIGGATWFYLWIFSLLGWDELFLPAFALGLLSGLAAFGWGIVRFGSKASDD